MTLQRLVVAGGLLELIVVDAGELVVLQSWAGSEFTVVPQQCRDDVLEAVRRLNIEVEGR